MPVIIQSNTREPEITEENLCTQKRSQGWTQDSSAETTSSPMRKESQKNTAKTVLLARRSKRQKFPRRHPFHDCSKSTSICRVEVVDWPHSKSEFTRPKRNHSSSHRLRWAGIPDNSSACRRECWLHNFKQKGWVRYSFSSRFARPKNIKNLVGDIPPCKNECWSAKCRRRCRCLLGLNVKERGQPPG